VFLAVQTLTPLFSLTIPNFVVLFKLVDRKFNGNSKNVLKTVTFSLQVGVQAILSLTLLSNSVLGRSNFDTSFLPVCIKFCSVIQVIGWEI